MMKNVTELKNVIIRRVMKTITSQHEAIICSHGIKNKKDEETQVFCVG